MALLDLHSFQSQGQPFAMVGPRNNTGELEPFAHEAIESAVVARLGVNRIVEGWLSTYAEGIRRRQARASDGSRKAQLVTDPHYGVGTTEYMRSTGGWAITLSAASTWTQMALPSRASPSCAPWCTLACCARSGGALPAHRAA